MKNIQFLMIGLLIFGVSTIHASDWTNTESSLAGKAYPVAHLSLKEDYLKWRHKKSEFINDEIINMYDKNDAAVIESNLMMALGNLLEDMYNPKSHETKILGRIHGGNSKSSNFYIESRIIPGSTQTKQTVTLRVAPIESNDSDSFSTNLSKINLLKRNVGNTMKQFEKRGIDFKFEPVRYKDDQDFN
jgi:hypothetical protein